MARLSKNDLVRRIVTEEVAQLDYDVSYELDDLIERYGRGVFLYVEVDRYSGNYESDDVTVYLRRNREENDEEYNARLSNFRAEKARAVARKRAAEKAKEDAERAEYERLRAKFE